MELLKCPFCAHAGQMELRREVSDRKGEIGRVFVVRCGRCKAEGPPSDPDLSEDPTEYSDNIDRQTAKRRWNRRRTSRPAKG